MPPIFLHGLLLGLSLIVAIGAQNAFVLRQGLRREHVTPVVVLCALADAVLITAGVLGMARVIASHPGLAQIMAGAGAVFLAAYGWKALLRARHASRLQAAQGGGLSLGAALAQAAAFTLLNPHVYLDTVLLVGSIGAQHPPGLAQVSFIAGACTASVGWFTLLGFGARALAPVFARPRAWQVLDGIIGLTMLTLAALLLRHALAGA
ncbi:LysE/ArgO family amino acid transporter [Amphibiibacter pelophylacis]|uniref:LysE family transporter n=1 Tax=Amphibiibacter pelophylacis TaxID=1799477 RepID=A0ACC6P3Z6_9BURK